MGLSKLLQDEISTDLKLDWESILEPVVDKMSVSIDMIENDN